jgi:hypothetical protein
MRRMSWFMVCAFIVAMAASAGAQSKFSGKCNQSKPDPNYTVQVGDKADHSIVLAKVKCTWTSGDLGGVALKEEDDVVTSDISGKKSRDHGYGTGTLASGDKYFVRFGGTTTYEKNAPVSGTCTWNFSGGTGKLKGLTGKGTCTGKYDATGAAVFDVQGEYQVAAPKAK